jgi:anti-sigma-K factor RskA
MNIASYIQSGILEAYALGQVTPAERAEVERLLGLYPELATELKAIEDALAGYAMAHAIEPPEGLKAQILRQIEAAENAAPPSDRKNDPDTPRSNMNQWLPWLVASGVAIFSTIKLNDIHTNNQELVQQLKACETEQIKQQQLQQDIAFLNAPATQRINLRGDNNLQLTVHYNPDLQTTRFSPLGMPALPAGQDYQLWVIVEGNPAPIPLEVFQPTADPFALIPSAYRAQAQAFAVSVEPAGGSPNGVPTKVVMIQKLG